MADKKLKIGWFSFSCCEDSTIVFTELMNEHWQEWVKLIDFQHVKILQTKNKLEGLDVAFIEGALASKEQEEKAKEIRANAKKVVAVGACACTGMPSAQRNAFPEELQERIEFLLEKFNYGEKVKKLDEVIKVDELVPGCPMTEEKFLEILNKLLKEFGIK